MRERERAVAGQTPWSGLKCCQWQSDVPLNRITLKVSCHHIPASHYQGQGGAGVSGMTEWLGKAFPLWTGLELPVMPDKRWKRERIDEVLLVPWRRWLWNCELKGIPERLLCEDINVTNLLWIAETLSHQLANILPKPSSLASPHEALGKKLQPATVWSHELPLPS